MIDELEATLTNDIIKLCAVYATTQFIIKFVETMLWWDINLSNVIGAYNCTECNDFATDNDANNNIDSCW